MNKKIILCIGLIISCGLMKAESNNEPVLVKHFSTDIIIFNGSKKPIGALIQSNDPEFEKVALLHELEDGSFEDLGTIGYPKSQSQSDPTAKIVVLVRNKNSYWCEQENFIVATGRENFRDICSDAVLYRQMKKDNRKEIEEIVSKVSP